MRGKQYELHMIRTNYKRYSGRQGERARKREREKERERKRETEREREREEGKEEAANIIRPRLVTRALF